MIDVTSRRAKQLEKTVARYHGPEETKKMLKEHEHHYWDTK